MSMTSGPMAPSLTGKSQALSPTFRCADFALGFFASIAVFLAELNGWGDACWRPVRPEIRKPYAGQGQVRCNMALASVVAGLVPAVHGFHRSRRVTAVVTGAWPSGTWWRNMA